MGRKIRVAHVTEAWTGGIATYVETLIRHQSKSPDFEKPHLVCASNRITGTPDTNQAEVHYYKSSRKPWDIFSISKKIGNLIREINPDIVHLHSTFPGVYGRLFRLKNKEGKQIKTIYCAHGWSFVQENNKIARLIYVWIEKFLARTTDAIINVSHHEFDEAINAGIKPRNNYIVLSGVEDKSDSPPPSLFVDHDKTNQNLLRFGYIGRLDYKKGFDILVNVFESCARQNIKLFVIGKPDRDKETSIISKQSDKIIYLGWVPPEKIDEHISKLDAVIIPSRQEAFGLVALEAMRNGKPVIVSNRGALPELVINGYNGFIFSLDDPNDLKSTIEKINKEKLREMGKNAYKIYKNNFRIEGEIAEITWIYKRLLKAAENSEL